MGVITSSFVAGVGLLVFLQSTIPVGDAFKGFSTDVNALSQAKNLTEETYYGAADKWAAQIDYSKLSIEEAMSLAGHPMGETSVGYAGLLKQSGTWTVSGDEAGFKVALVKAMVASIESRDGKSMNSDQVSSALMAVLNHKSASGAMMTSSAANVARVVSGAADRQALSLGAITRYADMVKDGVLPAAGPMVFGVWETWVDGNPNHKSTDALWTKFNDGLKMTLASAEKDAKPGDRTVAQLKRMQTEMNSPAGRGKLVGYAAPEITFQWNSDPKAKKLSDYKGKVVVVDFWATWCGPCIASMPKLRELAAHYAGKNVVVLGVTSIQGGFWEGGKQTPLKDKPAEEIAMYPDYITRQNINWTIAVSDQNVFNPDYGVNGIPHMAIIDGAGKVRYRGLHPGAVSLAEKIKMIDPLLKEIK